MFFNVFLFCLKGYRGNLKLVSAIFHQIFIFHLMIALQKLKNVFYLIEKALLFLKIFKFLYFCLPIFFPLSAIALEVDLKKSEVL